MANVEPETPKASRELEGVSPSPADTGSGESDPLPQLGPGQSPGENDFTAVLFKRVRTPLVTTFVEN